MADSEKKGKAPGSGFQMEQGRIEDLVGEVMTLFASMQTFRRELASIRHPKQEEDRFDTIAEQLDAIVAATEEATNVIMDAIERISDMIIERRSELDGAGLSEWADGIDTEFQKVFEACSFQDITGQRIGKVVEELKFMNDKLASMVDIWGPEALSKEPLLGKADDTPEGEVLEGPALEGKGVSQDDIDKLFD
jgi:chemotaxis protein CheZ